MKKQVKIGNSQGFWGDSPGASLRLLQGQPDLDYLTLDYLAEVSLSIMAIQREKDPDLGFAKDFLDVVTSLIPLWKKGSTCKIVTNAGGLNPMACAKACLMLLRKAGLNLTVGVVYGDDVLEEIKNDLYNPLFNNLDTLEGVKSISQKLVTANAYFGAKPIVDALKLNADIVITGRVADPSLTVAPAMFHFGWKSDEYDKIASATIAGHLIECGTQVTGGVSTDWLTIPNPAAIGFPVVELFEDGSFVITKPNNTGGVVNEQTVKEQLLYEISDPGYYLSPDATVSFLNLKLEDEGNDRVRVTGAKGSKPPKTIKVSATYRDGFKAEGMLTIFGSSAVKKAKLCGKIILERVKSQGFDLDKSNIEVLGNMDVVPGVFKSNELNECVLRVAVSDQRMKAIECFTKEIAPLVTSGPQGVTGYISGRPRIREVYGFWPCLIDENKLKANFEVLK